MPCFELWFLLHFKDYSTKIYNNCSEVILDLKKYIPEYEKREEYFRKINLYKKMTEDGDLAKAKASAQRLCQEKEEADNPKFPFTEVYEVLTLLDSKGH